jgi:hypothetical protein
MPRFLALAEEFLGKFMIIFNISAGFCIFLVWAIGYGLHFWFPTMPTPLAESVLPILLFVLGGAAEQLDLRPRIFFIPLWLIGLAFAYRATFLYIGQPVFWVLVLVGLLGLYAFLRPKRVP